MSDVSREFEYSQTTNGRPTELRDAQILNGEPLLDDHQPLTDDWIQQSYAKLHRLASMQMLGESKAHTLSATSLVNEVYLRLKSTTIKWEDERQFLAFAAREMRRVLIDAARRKKAIKRGGLMSKARLDEQQIADVANDLIGLSDAVDALEELEPAKAELVRLRYFLGLTESEAAKTMGISRATASRHWTFARAWLLNFLTK